MKVLLAWEHGGGLGHLTAQARLARVLLGRGAEVTVAARSVQGIGEWLPVGVRLLPAPWAPEPGFARPPGNYADLLRGLGWGDAGILGPTVRAWRGLLELAAPDVVVTDSAPSLLLALRGRGVPTLGFHNPWGRPPERTPFPPFLPGLPCGPEEDLVAIANRARPPGSPPLGALADLWRGLPARIWGVPETDPWAEQRALAAHVGPVVLAEGGAPPEWPAGAGLRVFAYLRAGYGPVDAVLSVLERCGHPVLAHVAGRPARERGRLRITGAAVDLALAREEADLCVTHSILGTGFAFLARSVPVLLLPSQLEQLLTGLGGARLGGVACLPAERVEATFAEALRAALAPAFRVRASETRARLAAWPDPFEAVADALAEAR